MQPFPPFLTFFYSSCNSFVLQYGILEKKRDMKFARMDNQCGGLNEKA